MSWFKKKDVIERAECDNCGKVDKVLYKQYNDGISRLCETCYVQKDCYMCRKTNIPLSDCNYVNDGIPVYDCMPVCDDCNIILAKKAHEEIILKLAVNKLQQEQIDIEVNAKVEELRKTK